MTARPSLLVSVRDDVEAQAALAGGADIIDIKDPSRGPLGMADPDVLAAVLARCADRRPVSAALGEWRDHPDVAAVIAAVLRAHPALRYVKLGLSGAPADWPRLLAAAIAPHRDRFIAVAYADHTRAAAPPLQQVLDWAIQERVAGLLIDTAVKDGRGLFHWIPQDQWPPLLAISHRAGLPLAMAGSLDESAVTQACTLHPAIIAVRGLACSDRDRNAAVQASRVARLVQLMTAGSAAPALPAG